MHSAFDMVVGGGFEPPKLARQIYSLIPLATREPHHMEQVTLQVTLFCICSTSTAIIESGAGERSRTPDRLITSQLLYLLSYASTPSLSTRREYYSMFSDDASLLQKFLRLSNS